MVEYRHCYYALSYFDEDAISLNFRIGWHYDTDTDGDVDSSDPWYHFAYDEAWRQVATFRGSDTAPKEVFVHHAAGLDGHGGSSYIDSVLLREKDASTAWTAASNGLDERVFHCQNWRGDVSVVLSDDGSLLEWIKYSAYGVLYSLPAGDTDSDGDWDATDSSQLSTWISAPTYNILGDADLDGDLDTDDSGHANSITGTYLTLGRGVMSSTGINSRRGYAGYEYDSALSGARHISHVRFRVYDADLGRWTRRDPLGYVDGMSLYSYVQAYPILMADPMGLLGVSGPPTGLPCASGGCGVPSAPSSGGGGGMSPDLCAGGTYGIPQSPGIQAPGGIGPIICAGGSCNVSLPAPPEAETLCIAMAGPIRDHPDTVWNPGQEPTTVEDPDAYPCNKYKSSSDRLDCQDRRYSRMRCLTWYRDQVDDDAWMRPLADCPCRLTFARGAGLKPTNPNPVLWRTPSRAGDYYHPNAHCGMRTRDIYYNGAGQQCCYDYAGRLITSGRSAGTPDRSNPKGLISFTGHLLSDVDSFNDCDHGGVLYLYWRARPPNQGKGCGEHSVD